MIKEKGQVVQIDDTFIWVETAIKSTCKTCSAKSNCGTSSIAEAFAGKSVINQVVNTKQAKLGDVVEIGIPENSLLQGAFWVYMVPLILSLSTALIAQHWLSQFIQVSEGLVIVATLLGGGLGFAWAKWILARSDHDKYLPELLSVLPQPIQINQISD